MIALGGRKNKTQVGDKGIDGRIFPVSALDNVRKAGADELALVERFYAMQVKQKDKAGRPDIDAFETAMRRAKCEKGFFVSFDFSSDALREIQRFFVEEQRIIIPVTVQELPRLRPRLSRFARLSTSRSRTSWRDACRAAAWGHPGRRRGSGRIFPVPGLPVQDAARESADSEQRRRDCGIFVACI